MTIFKSITLAVAVSVATLSRVDTLAAETVIHIPSPSEIDITTYVEEVAVLIVQVPSASTTITDTNPTMAGSDSSSGPLTGMAQLQLMTNFCVGLDFQFQTVTDIRNYIGRYFGAAIGTGGNTLGVQPFVRIPDSGLVKAFGNTFGVAGSLAGGPLQVSAATASICQGVYDIYLGLVTKWDRTRIGEPMFAEPDIYTINITATIVP